MHIMFACLVGFLSGSILWSYLLGQLFYHVDIRDYGLDRNPGAMNAFQQRVGDDRVLHLPSVEAFYAFRITYCANLRWKTGSTLSLLEQEK